MSGDEELNFSVLLLQAMRTALEAHHGQTRKGSDVPYFIHPLRVALVVARASFGEGVRVDRRTAVMAALLHDVVEDTELTPAVIRSDFGQRVLEVVLELTQDADLPWHERRAQMVEACATMSAEARLIKLADREDNLRDMKPFGPESNEAYCAETLEMLHRLAGTSPEIETRIRHLMRETPASL